MWSEELTRLLFVWMVMLAAVHAQPMRIGLLVESLPVRIRAIIELMADVLVGILTGLLIYGAWGMMDLAADDTYTALGISVRWLCLALFLGAADSVT